MKTKILGGAASVAAFSLMALNPAVADTVSGSVTFTSAGEAISAYAVEVDSPGSRFNSAEIGLGYRPLDVGQLFNVGTLYGSVLTNPSAGPDVPGSTQTGTLLAFLAQNNLTPVGGAPKLQEVLGALNGDATTPIGLANIVWSLTSANSICASTSAPTTSAGNFITAGGDPTCFEVEAVAPLTVTDEGFVAANVELTGSFDPTVILSDALNYLEFVAQDVRNSSIVLANGLTATELTPLVNAILQFGIGQTLEGGGSLEQVIATVYNNPNLTTDTKNAIFQSLAEGGYLDGLTSVNGDADTILAELGVPSLAALSVPAGLLP